HRLRTINTEALARWQARFFARLLEDKHRSKPLPPGNDVIVPPLKSSPPARGLPPKGASSVFPRPLLDAYEKGELAVLVGSGLSLALDVVGNFPRWDELPERLIVLAGEYDVLRPTQLDGLRQMFKEYANLDERLTTLEVIKTALRTRAFYQKAL